MTNFDTLPRILAATALVTGSFFATASLADSETVDNGTKQMMPMNDGMLGSVFGPSALPVDTNGDALVSASEASTHASVGFARFESDGDGQMTEEEYMSGAPQAVSMGRRNMERLFINRAARFTAMDTDSDTNVILPEFMAAAQASYDRADTNKDGKVTVWEFRAQQNPF